MKINKEMSRKMSAEIGAIPKECYRNAVLTLAHLDAQDEIAKYVEGILVLEISGARIPIEHGWCTIERDGEIEIIEPTLPEDNWPAQNYIPAASYALSELWLEDVFPITPYASIGKQVAWQMAMDLVHRRNE